MRLIDGKFAPVACLACGAKPCEQASQCRTLPVGKNLQNMVESCLDSDFIPSPNHAGGLRYHGMSSTLSQLYHDGKMEDYIPTDEDLQKSLSTLPKID